MTEIHPPQTDQATQAKVQQNPSPQPRAEKEASEKPQKQPLKIQHTATASLSTQEIEELWKLYGPHHNSTPSEFATRITQKMHSVTRYRHRKTGELLGMTAVRFDQVKLANGMTIHTVYSGMSYIHPVCRGMRLLPRTLAHYGTRLKLRHPFGNVWLWSDAISYKPYVLSARSAKVLYPSRKNPTPPHVKEFMDWVGITYYGDAYNSSMGTVRKESNRLKSHVAPISEEALADPDIRFFVEHNPGYQNGDGLLNVIPLSWANLATSTWRSIQKRIKKRK